MIYTEGGMYAPLLHITSGNKKIPTSIINATNPKYTMLLHASTLRPSSTLIGNILNPANAKLILTPKRPISCKNPVSNRSGMNTKARNRFTMGPAAAIFPIWDLEIWGPNICTAPGAAKIKFICQAIRIAKSSIPKLILNSAHAPILLCYEFMSHFMSNKGNTQSNKT